MSIDISALGEAEEGEREEDWKSQKRPWAIALLNIYLREKFYSHTNLQVAVNSSFTYNNSMSLSMQIVNHNWDEPTPGNTTQQGKGTDY